MQIHPINPNSGKALTPIDCTPVVDITTKIAKARAQAKKWWQTPYLEKKEIFTRIAAEFETHVDAIAQHMHEEMGKPVKQAASEVIGFQKSISRSFDVMEKALEPERLDFDGGQTAVHYIPLGVAAVITPWNFPFGMPLSLLVPALLGGNTVLFKPSEITTATGLFLAELMNRHLPENVLQTVVGAKEQGVALTQGEIDLIAFVGSRETGKAIMKEASNRACRLILELGSKDAMVVAADADMGKAVDFAVTGSLRNSGQVCCSVERIYVEKTAYSNFVDEVLKKVAKVSVGEEKEAALCIGPMASKRQMDHVLGQLDAATKDGAKIEVGGKQLAQDGFFLEPTVVTQLNSSMGIMRDETFGPVICIQPVDSVDEGIELANDTRFGLTASLWMGDENQAREKALHLEAGLVGVNRSFGGAAGTPWAGAKESGFGYTGGVAGMRSFLQPRSITAKVS